MKSKLTGFSMKNPEIPPIIGGYGKSGFKTTLTLPEHWNHGKKILILNLRSWSLLAHSKCTDLKAFRQKQKQGKIFQNLTLYCQRSAAFFDHSILNFLNKKVFKNGTCCFPAAHETRTLLLSLGAKSVWKKYIKSKSATSYSARQRFFSLFFLTQDCPAIHIC